MRLLTALVFAVVAAFAVVPTVGATHPPDHKVTICHATSSAQNPYVVITVDKASTTAEGHASHGNDIIPPFPASGVVGGLNWTSQGQAIYANGCHVAVTPYPTKTPPPPTATPTKTPAPPTATPVPPTATPTNTPVPTATPTNTPPVSTPTTTVTPPTNTPTSTPTSTNTPVATCVPPTPPPGQVVIDCGGIVVITHTPTVVPTVTVAPPTVVPPTSTPPTVIVVTEPPVVTPPIVVFEPPVFVPVPQPPVIVHEESSTVIVKEVPAAPPVAPTFSCACAIQPPKTGDAGLAN